jgi:flagellar protein FlgJ
MSSVRRSAAVPTAAPSVTALLISALSVTALLVTAAGAAPAPVSAGPVSAAPVSAGPLSAAPVSAGPLSAAPVSAAAPLSATVQTTGGALNARAGASGADRVVRALPNGTRLSVNCQVFGQLVIGTVRSSAYWYRLGDGSYVADGFVRWRPARPAVQWCAGTVRTSARVATAGGRLGVRTGPRPTAAPAGSLPHGHWINVLCHSWGTRVAGTVRTSSLWYSLGRGRYVTAGFVAWVPAVPVLPYCGQAAPSVPAPSATVFIGRLARAAQLSRRRHGVPASVTLAQAILESGWGRSLLARRDHNLFGIKCFGDPGGIALGCRTYRTSECGPRGCYRTSAQFRAYANTAGSVTDHGWFLRSRPRYRAAFRYTADPDRFVREIHRAGYATSPTYTTNLVRVMRRYNLYRYDG